jgi:DUF4097 and DUF4098 domain-containing protein YvlB
MRYSMKKGILLIFSLCFLTIVFPQSRNKVIEKSFPANPGTNLFIKAFGDIDITTWNKREIYVKITLGGSEKYRDRYEFELDKRDETVRVITTKRGRISVSLFSIGRHYLRYQVKMPADIEVEIEQEDGDINIRDLTGNITVYSEDGDIFLDDIHTKRVSVETEDGDITIDNLSAEIHIDTEDGDIRTRYIDSDKISINAEDGNVELRLDKTYPNGRYTITAEDGDVDVFLDDNFKGEIDCEADDGGVRVDVRNTDILERKRHRFRGVIGKGHAYLKIRTSDGDITIND